MQTTVSERGQVSIPASLRKKYQLKPGKGVEWLEREGGIFIVPVSEDPIKAFRRKGKGEVAALLKERRREKKREMKKGS